MLSAAESICGEYIWGIYDLLVLPPSFPFGGMENPCLNFVTPTLLVSTLNYNMQLISFMIANKSFERVAEFRYSGTTTKIGYHKIPFCLGL
jgi:hypothetical protein